MHVLTAHKAINEHTIRTLVAELTNALASLHARGITHRDLKPENLLLGSDGHLRLIDFGLAHIHNKSAPQGLCGTGPFMAPEIFNTEKSYSSKVDIWALGACTYVFLTGHLPFEAHFMSQMEDKIKAGKYSLPVGHIISPPAQDFIRACLTVDVNTRPSAKDLLHHPWLNRNENLPQYTKTFADSHWQCLRAYVDRDIICLHKKVYAII
jgi:serine/threonine protein kinase